MQDEPGCFGEPRRRAIGHAAPERFNSIMTPQLLTLNEPLEHILGFTVPGIHTEKLGAANQPWDATVAAIVADACSGITKPAVGTYRWFAVYLRWHVQPAYYRQDLDNYRLKPILDRLTAEGLWPDDQVRYVRAIYSEAVLVESSDEQRVEVAVYGIV